MDGELNVSGIDGYGKDFLNRQKNRRKESSDKEGSKGDAKNEKAKTSGGKPTPRRNPPTPGDTLVDFLA